MLRVAVPNKGVLSEPAAEMLAESGYRQRRSTKDLVVFDPDNDTEFFYLRPRDIAVYVAAGTLDVGITGRDMLLETAPLDGERSAAVEVMPLGFGRSSFRFASPVGSEIERVDQLAGKRIATAYPVLLQRHLEESGIKADVVKLDGAVETACRLGVADAVCDVVETGTTLRAAGLHIIGEPVLGTGGIVPPPAGYWQKIQAVLKKYDILLVADEVVTGFGRLGSMFGSDHYGIEADLITIAKGLTSAYLPLSGTIVSDKVWNVLVQGSDAKGVLGHGWTYSAHPLCAAAGIANLELIDRLDLIANARDTGAYLRQALSAAVSGHRLVGDVRGEGMLAAVEFVADKDDRIFFDPALKVGPRIAAALLERGVIGRGMPQGDILGFAPPFCLTRDEADRIAQATRDAVEAVAAEL